MRITIDTAQPLSRTEADLLRLLLNAHPGLETPTEATPEPKKAAKKATKKAATPKKPEPEPEATEDTTEAGGDTTEPEDTEELDAELMQTAMDRATEFMNQGRRDEVKAALSAAKVGRVRDIENNTQLNEFLGALS